MPGLVGRIQLPEVIQNLLRNGSDAMNTVHDRPRDPLIGTEPDEGDRALPSVNDAGIGFDPQSMDKRFQSTNPAHQESCICEEINAHLCLRSLRASREFT